MMIIPRVSLKRVEISGVSAVLPTPDVKILKKKYGKELKVHTYMRKSKKPDLNGPVISIPVSEYLLGN